VAAKGTDRAVAILLCTLRTGTLARRRPWRYVRKTMDGDEVMPNRSGQGGAEAHRSEFQALKRDVDRAAAALSGAEVSMQANLTCRLAELQERALRTRAVSLDDLEARLLMIREIVAKLGPAGFLLHLVDAALDDLRAMKDNGHPA
jgi:hypothetical protein